MSIASFCILDSAVELRLAHIWTEVLYSLRVDEHCHVAICTLFYMQEYTSDEGQVASEAFYFA